MKTSRERHRDTAVDQSRRSAADESVLRAHGDEHNQPLLQARESGSTSLHSRIDELHIMLDAERKKRQSAEEEARRLSVKRSARITFLAQQRKEMLVQISQLRGENDRLSAEESRLREAAVSAEHSLRVTEQQLILKSSELEQLQDQFDAIRSHVEASESEKRIAATEEVEHLTAELEKTNLLLRECQQQLLSDSQSKNVEQMKLVATQRDRIIARLEQQTFGLQERLQREAAARRKAEGVVKRAIKDAGLEKVVQDTWLEIHGNDQVERLKKQVKALSDLNLIINQESSAAISSDKSTSGK